MSLLDEQYEPFNIVDKTTALDGYGAVETIWKMGAEIIAIVQEQSSTEAQIAMALSEKKTYAVITRKDVVLRQNDVLYRQRDGKTFRITSDSDEKATPSSATLNMRRCDAVDIILPTDIVIPKGENNAD